MRVIVPGPLGWQSSLPIQMTRSPNYNTSLRAIAVFMMMPPDDRPRKKGGPMGGNAQGRHSLSAVPPHRPSINVRISPPEHLARLQRTEVNFCVPKSRIEPAGTDLARYLLTDPC